MAPLCQIVRQPLIKGGAVATLVAALLFSLAEPLMAKGPQSVTISGPGIEQPLQLMGAENWQLMTRFMEQTGLWYATGDLPRPIEAPRGNLGPAHTITWINLGPPDKTVEERTFYQLLYLRAPGGPLIYTPYQESLEGRGQDRLGWAVAPKGLPDTLLELGVDLNDAPASGAFSRSALRYGALAGAVGAIIFAAWWRHSTYDLP